MARLKSEKPLTGAERQRKYRNKINLTTFNTKLDSYVAYRFGLLCEYYSVTKKEMLEKWINTEYKKLIDISDQEFNQLIESYSNKQEVKAQANRKRQEWQQLRYAMNKVTK